MTPLLWWLAGLALLPVAVVIGMAWRSRVPYPRSPDHTRDFAACFEATAAAWPDTPEAPDVAPVGTVRQCPVCGATWTLRATALAGGGEEIRGWLRN